MLFSHLIGPYGGLFELVVVFGERVHLLFEEIVDVPDRRVQIVLVCGATEGPDQAAPMLEAAAWTGAEILVELQEDVQVAVFLEDAVARQTRQEHLVHCDGFLEGSQVFAGRNGCVYVRLTACTGSIKTSSYLDDI